jgi:1-acyl-sn-glycerol-3-phosphate acyltransferase
MSFSRRVVVVVLNILTRLICRIHSEPLEKVPDVGPLIIVTNHVNIIEIPIIYTQLQPRPVTGLVLAHRWDSFWTRWLLNVAGAIPLRRGEADIAAFRKALEKLKTGHQIVIAPEGTRSSHGRLQQAHPGTVMLALRSGSPILPVAFFGSENYKDNLRRLKRTDFHIAVGRPFHLMAPGERVPRQMRRQMIDEVMYQLSALLPQVYRGFYADLEKATKEYLSFDD